jgi:hypothetical protein
MARTDREWSLLSPKWRDNMTQKHRRGPLKSHGNREAERVKGTLTVKGTIIPEEEEKAGIRSA